MAGNRVRQLIGSAEALSGWVVRHTETPYGWSNPDPNASGGNQEDAFADACRWRERWNQSSIRNGDWIASGRLFRVISSHQRPRSRIRDAEKVRLCRAVPFERRVKPTVQRG